jgi:hypothetical protein
MKKGRRTTWRSRTGTKETPNVKRKDEDVIENAGAEGQRSVVGGVAHQRAGKCTWLRPALYVCMTAFYYYTFCINAGLTDF